MTDTDGFDEMLDRDWTRYASRLVRHLTTLTAPGGFELLAETPTGPEPRIHVQRNAGDDVTVTVAGTGSVTRTTGEADDLARHIVSVLRTDASVPHPAFLQAVPPFPLGGLRERVSDTLARTLGRPAPVDADGDFVVVLDAQVIFVVVDADGPGVRLWAPLLHGIPETGESEDPEVRVRVLEELTELNLEWPHIKVVLVEDRLVATVDMLGDPFVPRHLSEMLDRLRGFLGAVDDRFARRFDGVRYGCDSESEADTHWADDQN
ncbi:hypothetical protein OED52_04625 [Rhodococcus sp. Z13]|uniref:Uncharacterized protein n=1 Tax=Rhodococcus sacchari TaxID=2962047 RepID=A0ACD4DIP5_9NOCA|nr:hypothetical protein [Rhodococcus sp. Z13]UYP19848.1 hypothetical protein OED52_04625 [Rhodococcus sp. Z13]